MSFKTFAFAALILTIAVVVQGQFSIPELPAGLGSLPGGDQLPIPIPGAEAGETPETPGAEEVTAPETETPAEAARLSRFNNRMVK
jgi:hypothetical protein